MIPGQGGSTGTARSSECCGKHQASVLPVPLLLPEPIPTPWAIPRKNWCFSLLLTREFWQGCPEQVSVIFLCQVLTGQAALGFNFLPSAGNWREKSTNISYILSKFCPVYLPAVSLSLLLLKFRKGCTGRTGMVSLHPPSFKILLESRLGVEIQVILPLWFNCYSSSECLMCCWDGIQSQRGIGEQCLVILPRNTEHLSCFLWQDVSAQWKFHLLISCIAWIIF